ncbi:MAG: DUF2191 domain-containing protein [Deltaproteobacteria bacterium]|nr:DUF2191 domain-containing protein [Deltaproteobacteria bacterium]
MKTTIDIADEVLRKAKRLAAKRNTTLKVVVEEALIEAIARSKEPASTLAVQTHTFEGRGLAKGLEWDDWSRIRDLAYEGRGS